VRPKKRLVLDAGTLFSVSFFIKFVFNALITSFTDSHHFRIALQTDWRREMAIFGSGWETDIVISSAYAMMRTGNGKSV
jgi:hypothetical protein